MTTTNFFRSLLSMIDDLQQLAGDAAGSEIYPSANELHNMYNTIESKMTSNVPIDNEARNIAKYVIGFC